MTDPFASIRSDELPLDTTAGRVEFASRVFETFVSTLLKETGAVRKRTIDAIVNGLERAYSAGAERGTERDRPTLENIRREVAAARAQFPSNKQKLAALGEEFGELCQALIECDRMKVDRAAVYHEAIQVAAMAVRIAEEGSAEFDYFYSPELAAGFTPTSNLHRYNVLKETGRVSGPDINLGEMAPGLSDIGGVAPGKIIDD